MAGLSASTWGDPNATKRILMIHGLTSSSHFWHRVAQAFTAQGYFVIAPDILGHGLAGRGSDYSVTALTEELRPFFFTTPGGGNDQPFDVVIGHSLGGVMGAKLLLWLKSTQPVHVVLIDPPLEQSAEALAFHRNLRREELEDPKTPEAYLQEWPLWTKEEAIAKPLGLRLCDVATSEAIFDQNSPHWSFAHLLSTVPNNVRVTVLVADPSKFPCTRMEELEPYPHVNAKVVWGATHGIPVEFPQLVIDTALEFGAD